MAMSPRTKKTLPSVAQEYRGEPPGPTEFRVGVAMSGGGIRSAAFNLGALQALQANGALERTSYLAAVSGGNYIASALTIAAAHSDPPTNGAKPLWGTGSPEERYLRQHTDYLAPGYTGTLWMGSSMVYGFLLNYLPFMLCMMIAGRVIGWLLFTAEVRLSDLRLNGLSLPRSPLLVILAFAGIAFVLAALWLVAFRRLFKEDKPGNFGESRSERWSAGFLMATGVIAVLIALPALAELYGWASLLVLTKVFGEPAAIFETFAGRAFAVAFWLVISLVMASAALVLGRRFRALRLMLTLSFVASAGLLLVPLLSALEFSTRHGLDSVWDVVGVAGGGLFVLLMAVAIHNRRYSMHNVYRERLSSAFALRRNADSVAEPLNYEKRLYFSQTAPREGYRVPELVVCCAVNLTTDDVPVGRFAESFTFERGHTGGALFGYTTTSAIENDKGVAGTQLTLPSIMAVSGAALSPLMGRHTYPPLRFLMALTNIRLGVWIKNPNHERWSGLFADTADADHESPESPTDVDHREGESRTGLSKALAWIRDGWHEPGALYVLREALGAASSTRRYIYLTDGGHWENLGLVELLRRQCTHVLCFDASCDTKGLGLDVGRAIALARSDLNAQVDLNPRSVLPGTDGFSDAMAVDGTVIYPTGQCANLVYAKATLTKDASWDLHAFKARDSRFPNHSTTQQTFTDEQFEAYRKLGYDAGLEALVKLRLPGLMSVGASGNGDRR